MVPPDLDHATRAWAGEVLDALRAGGHDPGDSRLRGAPTGRRLDLPRPAAYGRAGPGHPAPRGEKPTGGGPHDEAAERGAADA